MQLFVRDASTVVLHAADQLTVQELKAMFTLKAYGVEAPEPWLLTHNGRQLDDAATLAAAGVLDGATLMAAARVRGGGGDGGSTGAESRSCYLEMYAEKKPEKVNPAEALLARWTRCHLSGERLAPPCVVDELGCLFNKDALVHALLNRTMPPGLAHITGLKHLTPLTLEPIPKRGGGGGGGGGDDVEFMCPVTGLEMNGRFRFVVHTPTGRAVSERALKEAPEAVEELLGARPTPDTMLPVNPTGAEADALRARVAARMAAEREKKAKKEKRRRAAGDAAAVATAAAGAEPAGAGAPGAGAAAGARRPAAAGAAAAGGLPLPSAAAAYDVDAMGGVKLKRARVVEKVPANATPDVYASIFHKAGEGDGKETYCCRAVSGRPTLTN